MKNIRRIYRMLDRIKTPQDIGLYIKQLRKSRAITGEQLGKQVGLSQAKISKIETGAAHANAKDIKSILNILDCPETIQQQVAAVLQLSEQTPHIKYRSIHSQPHTTYKRELRTRHIRCFLFNVIPALLQLPSYHKALQSFEKPAPGRKTQHMSELLARQDLLWDPAHTFHFILSEAALYTMPATTQVQLMQLDRLERLNSLPNVKIGFVPLEAGLLTVEHTNFVLYDQNTVLLILTHQEQTSTDPEDIIEHIKMFDELDKKALYGDQAQVSIQEAMNHFR